MTIRVESMLTLLSSELGTPAHESREELRIPFEKYMRALTVDLLGRTASPDTVDEWVNHLLTGATIQSAASCLLHSHEYRERQIADFYERLLGRKPSAEGMILWTGLLAAGRSQEEILAAMLSSNEYFNRNGSTNDRYVKAIFQDILQRRSVEIEADAWIALLNSHSASRLCIAFDFVTSDDYRRLLVRNWHWRFLRREPSHETVEHSLEEMKNGLGQDGCLAKLLSSREYFVRIVTG